MKLQHLIEAIGPCTVKGPADKEITSLTADSRKAAAGGMFVAVRGVTVDGHTFIPSLAGSGVAAYVVETLPDTLEPEATYIVTDDSARALGHLASRWYGDPSKKLRLVGVTGTNGKTTTATLIYEMARMTGHKAGLLSTVVNYIDTEAVHASQTTPDAVVNVLNAIRDVLGSKGSILTVVGAGGNRDKGKRPIMAQEAARLSQRVLLTSDNPRFEEPEAILRDMEAGLAGNPEWLEKTVSITDRRTAIDTAVRQAMPGDVILIAGKGHEDYQEIRGVKHHFDDREEVRRALAELR